ncbi:MAG: hypothetical protein ACRYHQ_03345 [Janthinobacterium lividum]
MTIDRRYNRADEELLAVCARLTLMQAEWQRLYDATSDTGPLTTRADLAWQYYGSMVWPGVDNSDRGDDTPKDDDIPARLRLLRATTRAGQAAKASAILALEEASGYTDSRNDSWEILVSLVRNVAGFDTHNLGEEAASAASLEPMA